MKKAATERMPYLVTTEHKGVFFGYGTKADRQATTIDLEDCRMCTYWSPDMRGVFGLATRGPDSRCKIGPAVSVHTLHDVTSIASVTEDAVKRWESEPWAL